MSIIGDIVGTVAKAVLPAVIDTIFPPAALFPGLVNMASNMFGDMLGKAVDGALQDLGAPKFLRDTVQDMIKQAVQGTHQQCDPAAQDHAQGAYGNIVKNTLDDIMGGLQEVINKWKGEMGGKGGKGGAGSSGPVTFRDLAKLLGQLEAKEAERVKQKVEAANEALSKPDVTGTGDNGQLTKEEQTQQAGIKASQFEAMEDSKAEAQIFQALSSAISEVMKNFGGSLQTAARG